MSLRGLHLLLTYQCNLECNHCFVWGSPLQTGTMTLVSIQHILQQAKTIGTVEFIYFEGGEPFLYYPVLLKGVQEAAAAGFRVGLVTNSYWATEVEDALEWLKPFVGLIEDLSISSDLFHWSEKLSQQAKYAMKAAEQLAIPMGIISVAPKDTVNAISAIGTLPIGESKIMFRGRAVEKLISKVPLEPWSRFIECPYENLREPGRVHVDPLGSVHICQGISLGNIFHTPLSEIFTKYNPDTHPITSPLLQGGPAELVRRYQLSCKEGYADACHLCYEARTKLRDRFPDILTPDQIYGVMEEQV